MNPSVSWIWYSQKLCLHANLILLRTNLEISSFDMAFKKANINVFAFSISFIIIFIYILVLHLKSQLSVLILFGPFLVFSCSSCESKVSQFNLSHWQVIREEKKIYLLFQINRMCDEITKKVQSSIHPESTSRYEIQ